MSPLNIELYEKKRYKALKFCIFSYLYYWFFCYFLFCFTPSTQPAKILHARKTFLTFLECFTLKKDNMFYKIILEFLYKGYMKQYEKIFHLYKPIYSHEPQQIDED